MDSARIGNDPALAGKIEFRKTGKEQPFKLSHVDGNRVVDTFVSSAEIWAPSGHEKPMAEKMIREFQAIGIEGMKVEVDDAASRTGGDTGNVIIDIPATPDAPKNARNIALSYHMDRVPVHAPGVPVDEPVNVEITSDGIIRSKDSRSNIAADDRAGYAAIKEAIQLVHQKGIPHGLIRVIGFTNEEPGVIGAGELDPKYLNGLDFGFEMDGGAVGNIIRASAGISHFRATIRGQSAPSIHPRDGKNALLAGVDAINKLTQLEKSPGQIINVSNFESGSMYERGSAVTNVVPDQASVSGEFRGRTPEDVDKLHAQVESALRESAEKHGVAISIDYDNLKGYNISEDSSVVAFAKAATQAAGVKPNVINTMGGSDANQMNLKGLPTVVIGSGAQLQHTEREYTTRNELVRGTQVIMAFIAATSNPVIAAAIDMASKPQE